MTKRAGKKGRKSSWSDKKTRKEMGIRERGKEIRRKGGKKRRLEEESTKVQRKEKDKMG
jgi:hypothetical protein